LRILVGQAAAEQELSAVKADRVADRGVEGLQLVWSDNVQIGVDTHPISCTCRTCDQDTSFPRKPGGGLAPGGEIRPRRVLWINHDLARGRVYQGFASREGLRRTAKANDHRNASGPG
jgi:hypothetical protein